MNELLEGLQIRRPNEPPGGAAHSSRSRRRNRPALLAGIGVAAAAATASAYFVGTRPVPVDVITVTAPAAANGSAPLLTAGGYVRDAKVVYVGPKVAGRMVSLSVREGDRVQVGDVIAVIDSRDLDQEAAEARANYELAAANLRKLQVGSRPEEIAQARATVQAQALAHQRAERELARTKALFDAGLVSAQALDQAETTVRAGAQGLEAIGQSLLLVETGPRLEEIETARAAVAAAQARLATATNRQDYTRVRAPVAGRVLKKFRNVGDFVSPDVPFIENYETVAVGSPVVSLATLGPQEVTADITETEIAKVALGQRVEVSPNAYPEQILHGTVTQVSPRADKNKNTVEVKVTLEPSARALPYDMSVKLTVLSAPTPSAPPLIRVPSRAVTRNGDKRFVFVASASRAASRGIETGPTQDGLVVVTSGLADGDRVIVDNTSALKDGTPIRVKP